MTIVDLLKATVTCAAIAFLIFNYPVIGQVLLIGFLTLLWLVYARKTFISVRLRRRRA